MTGTERFSRSPQVLWRLAPDRVLLRRAGPGGGTPAELGGHHGLVWLALDPARTEAELVGILDHDGVADPVVAVAEALAELLDHGMVERSG